MTATRGIMGLLLVLALLPGSVAAEVPGEMYHVRLRAFAAADEPDVVAAQIASAARGEVVETGDGVVTMRLSPSQARVVAADPRVDAVIPATSRGVTATAETMAWRTGVPYAYDGSGNIKQIGTDDFLYDAVGRIVQSETNGIRRNYAYDAYGNRTKCRENEGTSSEGDCQYGLIGEPATNRLGGVAHDGSGNVTAFGSHSYTYDAVNMQTRDVWGANVREYVYTADDERLAVYKVGSGWRWTVRDTTGKVLRELTSTDGPNGPGTANWQWSNDFIWRDGLLLASRQREGATVTTYHYHLDDLGTPRRITDDADRIVGTHDYFPFGGEASGGLNEPSLSLHKFTGHERDVVDGESWDTLDYMHARFESPAMGRFLSVDRGGFDPKKVQTWNRYVYTNNNPISYTDPDGREPNKAQATNLDGFLANVRRIERENPGTPPVVVLSMAATRLERGDDSVSYLYTQTRGWIDSKHFFAAANSAESFGEGVTGLLGLGVELKQVGTLSASAFSYEDMPSNTAGADFGDDHLNGGSLLSKQIETYLEAAGASAPSEAPNYQALPGTVPEAGSRSDQSSGSRHPAVKPCEHSSSTSASEC